MKAIDRIKNKIKDTFLYEKQFNSLKNAIKLVRFNENYDKITAIHYEETKTLRFFKEYNFKRNDKLIDNHDNIYYVEEVKINQPFSIQLNTLTKEEKELFLKLISVKGLGPKMALPMLATGSISMIEEAIETENINYLKKFPKIGDKVARQLVLDLKGKLNVINTGLFKREDHSSELFDALVGLGYKQVDVKKIVSKVDPTLDLENQIKEALKLLLK